MLRAAWVLLAVLMGSSAVAHAFEVEVLSFAEKQFLVVTVDVRTDTLQLFLLDDQQVPYGSFAAINQALASRQQRLTFATNAGMFHANYLPVGLYIDGGHYVNPLNTAQGWGNFFMQPNGVFLQDQQGHVHIVSTQDYPTVMVDSQVKFATQSGPLLLYNGKINAHFKPDSNSRFVRNAVGIVSEYEAKFVLTQQAVSLYALADFFKQRLGIKNALYLDGSVSSIYLPQLNRHDQHRRLGPMVGVVADIQP